jgi:3-hydroxyisobutyrate dehydrogenase-like beta-hydroxyacid dehydrogenase
VVKGVEQLALGLSAAACLEALAYGASFGFSAASLCEALQQTPLSRAGFEQFTQTLLREGGEAVSTNYAELPHVLAAGERQGQRLPLAQALLEFLRHAPPSVIERGRHIPSLWVELKRKPQTGP